jgi:predicted nicotinamide N-methyase
MSDANSDNKTSSLQLLDPQRKRDPPKDFECGEYLEQNVSTNVRFFCTLPDTSRRLTFSCRDRSVGVLGQKEKQITNEEIEESQEDVNVDPNFFDLGYTLAGRTGFQVWAGTRIVLETLLFPSPGDCSRLSDIQKELSTSSKKVLELGAGVGVVSLSLAASTAAQVLMTDLPTLVEYSILPNLRQNANQEMRTKCSDNSHSMKFSPPAWLCSASSNQNFEEEEIEGAQELVFPVGDAGGWASVAAVDWTKPLSDEISSIASELDWIIASDCVWLMSMLDALLNTVESLFQKNKSNARLLLSFQRRETSDASRFTRIETIVDSVHARGWDIECLAWRYTYVDGDSKPKEVVVLEIAQ